MRNALSSFMRGASVPDIDHVAFLPELLSLSMVVESDVASLLVQDHILLVHFQVKLFDKLLLFGLF
jgi:hypothetical protein